MNLYSHILLYHLHLSSEANNWYKNNQMADKSPCVLSKRKFGVPSQKIWAVDLLIVDPDIDIFTLHKGCQPVPPYTLHNLNCPFLPRLKYRLIYDIRMKQPIDKSFLLHNTFGKIFKYSCWIGTTILFYISPLFFISP
jgi:hypothetical protein